MAQLLSIWNKQIHWQQILSIQYNNKMTSPLHVLLTSKKKKKSTKQLSNLITKKILIYFKINLVIMISISLIIFAHLLIAKNVIFKMLIIWIFVFKMDSSLNISIL